MDSQTLVKDQIIRGARLVTRLRDRGFPLDGAFWALTQNYAQWRLYLISSRSGRSDEFELYRQVNEVAAGVSAERDDPLDPVERLSAMLVPPTHPLAQGVLERYRADPDSTPARMDWGWLGPTTVEGAYIYPANMFQTPAPAAG